jgi:hypothetical protein
MSRVVRSRRAGLSPDEIAQQPLYARMLGLRHMTPSGFLCFVFLEGAVALGILLALAELVSWWGVLVLPLSVAVMVKLNDIVAGMLARPPAPRTAPPRRSPPVRPAAPPTPSWSDDGGQTVDLRGRLSGQMPRPGDVDVDAGALNGPPVARLWADQRVRQSATRRYE